MLCVTPGSTRRWECVPVRRGETWLPSSQTATDLTLPPALREWSWSMARATLWSPLAALWRTDWCKGNFPWISIVFKTSKLHVTGITIYVLPPMRTEPCASWTESSTQRSSTLSTLTSAVQCATLSSQSMILIKFSTSLNINLFQKYDILSTTGKSGWRSPKINQNNFQETINNQTPFINFKCIINVQ